MKNGINLRAKSAHILGNRNQLGTKTQSQVPQAREASAKPFVAEPTTVDEVVEMNLKGKQVMMH